MLRCPVTSDHRLSQDQLPVGRHLSTHLTGRNSADPKSRYCCPGRIEVTMGGRAGRTSPHAVFVALSPSVTPRVS
ncbi:hypothetical protein BaRGS_00015803 [Batillaria attramentaria]|uniref:Uncharacterized protein n=1 Tax=Batillaria attramentaria TaxID=370345 RepID=A0ABD0L0G7_9CAEN